MALWFQATVTILLAAWLIDNLIGYPALLFRRIGHPVTWIGALIGWCDRHLNRETDGLAARRALGLLALMLIILIPTGLAVALEAALTRLLPSWAALAVTGLLASSLLAGKSLRDHVNAVTSGLERSIEDGRHAVAMIVGRDTRALDEAGIARAAIESLAANTADGIIAPAFWCLLFGLPGLVFYKAVNTADSMIGHRSERHLAFGWAAARLDDLINLPASRLTALLFAAAAAVLPGALAGAALKAAWRDAGKHPSPNAGWPEAAMAGALGFALGGPRSYQGETIDLPCMGQGRAALHRRDIARAQALQNLAMWLFTLGLAVGWIFLTI
jgi:adenosylcobinamide-phosphate synthase